MPIRTSLIDMTFTDYVLDIVLFAIVIRQIREARLDVRTVLLPIGICVFVAMHYLHGIPTGDGNLTLIAVFTLLGVGCGVLSGLTTRVRADGGRYPLIKAGWVAAGTWVASMGFRFGFAVWAAHGGDATLARFSTEHGITSGEAWTAALVLMALGEVFVRTLVLVVRGAAAVNAQRVTTVAQPVAA